jgi:hypothetical protein
MYEINQIAPPIIDWNNLWLFVEIFIVTLLGGGLGGLVNYFLAQSEKKAGESQRRPPAIAAETASTSAEQPNVQEPVPMPDQFLSVWQSMIIGVAAALLVPLLLSLIQSNLFDSVGTDVGKLFIYTGFCVAAGISSRTFVRGMADYIAKKALRTSEEADRKSETAMEASKNTINTLDVEAKRLEGQITESKKLLDESKIKMQQDVEEFNKSIIKSKEVVELNIGELALKIQEIFGVIDNVERKLQAPPVALTGKKLHAEKPSPLPMPQNEIESLESQYSDARKNPSSANRTYEMTRIIRRMIDLIEDQKIEINVSENLNSTDRGKRLTGIAYLCANPNMNFLKELVNVISIDKGKDKSGVTWWEVEPFAQYWGIEAISRILQGMRADNLEPDTLHALRAFMDKLDPSTDRYSKLSRILKELAKT